MTETTRLKIRERHRIQASPRRGLRPEWWEWQVLDGQRIVARFDFEHEAKRWVEQHGAEFPA